MQHGLVFDVWVYRRDSDAVRYLILRTSVEKAEKWFNGGRFWQIPSNLLADGDTLVPAVRRCLDSYGIDAAAIWAVEHTYTIYNRRFDELQTIVVVAAEAEGTPDVRLSEEHSEYRWATADECDALLGFRGLKEGLEWTRRYITETSTPLPELQLV